MAYEYIVNGKRVTLPVNPSKIAVRFREPSDAVMRRSVIDPKPQVGSFDGRFEVPDEKLTIVDVAQPDGPGPLAAAAGALNADPVVEHVAPVFDLGTAQAVPTDRLLVGFKPETGGQATDILAFYGGQILDQKGDEYVVRLPPATDPFAVIADLGARAEVDYAEPDFVTIGKHTPRSALQPLDPTATPEPPFVHPALLAQDESEESFAPAGPATPQQGDPLEQFQYALGLTQAREALQLVQPSQAVKVAILDEGVDVVHNDLAGAFVGGFDAIDGDADQQPNPWDAHGTACAGLAVASYSNGIGVRGIAAGCSLLAVRIAHSPFQGADWVSTSLGIRNAIDWAWMNGADILSNSWGGGPESSAIINAFERARVQGRAGRGCVVVVAAGNAAGPVDFPGKLPNVLTVSASNELDEPKTRTSADGEGWWGSNFGPAVDVAAPGVHNYTTDISGADGYNAGGALHGDYVSNFNGTSSSTPIVAGVAALVLSANPNLREPQVRQILKETADKVGTVVYTNGRNDQMGHGRLNAFRAVERALNFL